MARAVTSGANVTVTGGFWARKATGGRIDLIMHGGLPRSLEVLELLGRRGTGGPTTVIVRMNQPVDESTLANLRVTVSPTVGTYTARAATLENGTDIVLGTVSSSGFRVAVRLRNASSTLGLRSERGSFFQQEYADTVPTSEFSSTDVWNVGINQTSAIRTLTPNRHVSLRPQSVTVKRADTEAALAVSSITPYGDPPNELRVAHATHGGDVIIGLNANARWYLGMDSEFALPWDGTARASTADINSPVAPHHGAVASNAYPSITGFEASEPTAIKQTPGGIWLMFPMTPERLVAESSRFSSPAVRTLKFQDGTRFYGNGLFADDGWTVDMKVAVPNRAQTSTRPATSEADRCQFRTGPDFVHVSGRDRLGRRTGGMKLVLNAVDGTQNLNTAQAGPNDDNSVVSLHPDAEYHWFGVEVLVVNIDDNNVTVNLYGIRSRNARSDMDFAVRGVPRSPGDTTFRIPRVRFGAMVPGTGRRLDVTLVDAFPIISDADGNPFSPTSLRQVEGRNAGGSGGGAGMNYLTASQPSGTLQARKDAYGTVTGYAPTVPAGQGVAMSGGFTVKALSLLNPTLPLDRLQANNEATRVVVDVEVTAVDALGAPVAGVPVTVRNPEDTDLAADTVAFDPYPEWSATVSYRVGEIVLYNGAHWEAFSAHSGTTPGSDESRWRTTLTVTTLEWSSRVPYAAGTRLTHDGQEWVAVRPSTNSEPSATSADWDTRVHATTSPAATTGSDGRATVRRIIWSARSGRGHLTDGTSARIRVRDAAYTLVDRAVTLAAAGINRFTIQVSRDAEAPATVPAGALTVDAATKSVTVPAITVSPRQLYGMLKRDLPDTLAPFFSMSGNTLTLDADWDVSFTTPATSGLAAGPAGDTSNRLILQGTGAYDGAVGDGMFVTDAGGITARLSTGQAGATVVHSKVDSRVLLFAADGTTTIKAWSQATPTSNPARLAASDIDVSGIVRAGEEIRGMTWVPERRAILMALWSATASTARVAATSLLGAPMGASTFTSQPGPINSICHIDSTRMAVAHRVGANWRLDLCDPSRVFASRPLELTGTTLPTGPQEIIAVAWTGNRLLLLRITGTSVILHSYFSNLQVDAGNVRVVGAAYNGIRGAANLVELDRSRPSHLYLLNSASQATPVQGVDYADNRPGTWDAVRHHALPGITASSAMALTAFRDTRAVGEVTTTTGADGVARIEVPSAERASERGVTVKKEGYDPAHVVINPAVPDHAVALARNANIDLSVDISDYDLTASGGSSKNVFVALGSTVSDTELRFGDTYDLKASPDRSKRLLDAVLSTEDGVKFLHRYYEGPSPNNMGRVFSVHPTYVNILPGWLNLVRKAGLPANSRAVFGVATYIGDGETFYRPPEKNGGYVEIADPAVFVRFDSARTRTVSREIIEEPGNQAAIASAVLDSVPAGEADADPATTKTVSNVLYGLRDGPGSLTLPTEQSAYDDLADAVVSRVVPTDAHNNSIGKRIQDIDTIVSGGFVRDTTNRDHYNVRGASPTLTATASVDASAIETALSSTTVGTFTPGTVPTSLRDVLALLANIRLRRDGTSTPAVYDVEATGGGASADDILAATPQAATTSPDNSGTLGRLIADGMAKAKRLSFAASPASGEADLKVTLDGEGVRLVEEVTTHTEHTSPLYLFAINGVSYRDPATLAAATPPAQLDLSGGSLNSIEAADSHGGEVWALGENFSGSARLRRWDIATGAEVSVPAAAEAWAHTLGNTLTGLVVTDDWIIVRRQSDIVWYSRRTNAQDPSRTIALGGRGSATGGLGKHGDTMWEVTSSNTSGDVDIAVAYTISTGARATAMDMNVGATDKNGIAVTATHVYVIHGSSFSVRTRAAPATVIASHFTPNLEGLGAPSAYRESTTTTRTVPYRPASLSASSLLDAALPAVPASAPTKVGGVLALLSRVRMVQNPANTSQWRIAAAAEDVSKTALSASSSTGNVRMDFSDFAAHLSMRDSEGNQARTWIGRAVLETALTPSPDWGSDTFGQHIRGITTPTVLSETDIQNALRGATLGTFDASAVPTTMGDVLALLARIRLVETGSSTGLYNVRADPPTVTATATATVSSSAIASALNATDLPSVPTGTPTTLGGVLAMLSRMGLVEDNGVYDVRATLASETVSPESGEGSVLKAIRDKTDGLNFDGTDVMATLGTEEVTVSSNSRGAIADDVLNEAITGHTSTGTFGGLLSEITTTLTTISNTLTTISTTVGNIPANVWSRAESMITSGIGSRLKALSASAIANAVKRAVPDADGDPENPAGSLQRRVVKAADEATLARQGIINTLVRDGTASTLTLRDDDGNAIVTWDLTDIDGNPAGAGVAYTRTRRASA